MSHPMHGTNPASQELAHRMTAAAKVLLDGPAPGVNGVPPCPYDWHRHSDWTCEGAAKVLCGICRPPFPTIHADAFHPWTGQWIFPEAHRAS